MRRFIKIVPLLYIPLLLMPLLAAAAEHESSIELYEVQTSRGTFYKPVYKGVLYIHVSSGSNTTIQAQALLDLDRGVFSLNASIHSKGFIPASISSSLVNTSYRFNISIADGRGVWRATTVAGDKWAYLNASIRIGSDALYFIGSVAFHRGSVNSTLQDMGGSVEAAIMSLLAPGTVLDNVRIVNRTKDSLLAEFNASLPYSYIARILETDEYHVKWVLEGLDADMVIGFRYSAWRPTSRQEVASVISSSVWVRASVKPEALRSLVNTILVNKDYRVAVVAGSALVSLTAVIRNGNGRLVISIEGPLVTGSLRDMLIATRNLVKTMTIPIAYEPLYLGGRKALEQLMPPCSARIIHLDGSIERFNYCKESPWTGQSTATATATVKTPPLSVTLSPVGATATTATTTTMVTSTTTVTVTSQAGINYRGIVFATVLSSLVAVAVALALMHVLTRRLWHR